ncbi:MAG: putative ABC transporter permease [Candidatus Schmidhempelia sp.]|nr:putative ABC transporter permease [Candidatus Schmidhempelia sp.]
MKSEKFQQLVFYFFLYSFIGWVDEEIYCFIIDKQWVNRGFLLGPYCPIYGIGALIFIHLLEPFKKHFIALFVLGIFLCTLLEYVTSWGLEQLFDRRWWDYSQYRYNYQGRICLLNSLLFGVMGLLLVYIIHPLSSQLIYHLTKRQLMISSHLIIFIMVIDLGCSILSTLMLKINQTMP